MLHKTTDNSLLSTASSAVFCQTCLKSLKAKKIPSISVCNGLFVEPIPEELDLTDLEEQFIARNLVFMKVVRLPKSRMKAVKDKIVNVPMTEDDIAKTIYSLPRPQNDACLVPVQLKRKLEMKNSYLEELIRPQKLIDAVKKLQQLGNGFYQDITINESFLQNNE